MNAICNFMEKKLQGKSSGSLYVSGAPGTGKTVSLTKALNTMRVCHFHMNDSFSKHSSFLKQQHGNSDLYLLLSSS